MQIDIFGKNITLDEPLKVFVDEKIGGLAHLFGGDEGQITCRVEIGKPSEHHQKGFFYAEANMHIGGALLRAQAQHADLRSAIVEVKDALQIQIKKFKEKNQSRQ